MNAILSLSKPNASCEHESPTSDEIAEVAYYLYIQHGRQDGHYLEDWHLAERLLIERASCSDPVQALEAIPRQKLQPVDSGESPFGRDEGGSASREETRRETTKLRPAGRQTLRRPERSGLAE